VNERTTILIVSSVCVCAGVGSGGRGCEAIPGGGVEAGERASDESSRASRNGGASAESREAAETGGKSEAADGGGVGVGEMSRKRVAWIVGLGDEDGADVKSAGERGERGRGPRGDATRACEDEGAIGGELSLGLDILQVLEKDS
jgi:hypothetical protein